MDYKTNLALHISFSFFYLFLVYCLYSVVFLISFMDFLIYKLYLVKSLIFNLFHLYMYNIVSIRALVCYFLLIYSVAVPVRDVNQQQSTEEHITNVLLV